MGNTPEQVRRAAERAEELLNQANGVEQPTEVQLEPEEPTQESEVVEAADTTPQEPPAGEQPPREEPQSGPNEETWEQRYRTLQGMFNAGQRQWQTEKSALEARLQALEKQTQPAPTQKPEPEAKTQRQRRITDKDIETYGPDLVELINRAAADMADDIVAQRMQELKPELEKTKKQVTEVAGSVYQNSQQRFLGELERVVPDWQQIDTDPRWLAWLGEVDPLSGVPRQAYLDNAKHKLDHNHAAALFNAFKAAAGLNKPDESAPAAPSKPKLSPQPRTVGNAVAPTPREPEVGISRAEIDAHYRRASLDRRYGASPEYQAMEQRIATALAAGRVS